MDPVLVVDALARHVVRLAADMDYLHCEEYARAWRFLARCLAAQESVVRAVALSYLRRCVPFVRRTVGCTLLADELCRVMAAVMKADEVARNRTLAAWNLSYLMVLLCTEKSVDGKVLVTDLHRYIALAVQSEFQKSFSSIIDSSSDLSLATLHFGKLSNTPKSIVELRIALLRCLASLWLFSIADSDYEFLAMADIVLTTLLHVDIHFVYVTAALDCITDHMPHTRYNRSRIELSYRHRVIQLIRNESRGPYHPALKRALNKFVCTWYRQPIDHHILLVDPTSLSNGGYAFRRRLLLLKSKSEVHSTRQNTSETSLLSRNRSLVPLLSHPSTTLTKNSLSSISNSTTTNTDQTRLEKSIDFEPEIESIERDLFDLVGKEMLTITMPHEMTIEFCRYPYIKQAQLTNHSDLYDLDFNLQTYPSRYFTVIPAYGTVPKSSSITLSVMFHRHPEIVADTSSIQGYMRVRDKYGFPLSRIPLYGISPPTLRCSVEQLDFGYCAVGESRILIFVLQNLSITDCNCAATVASKAVVSPFHVTPIQALLLPGELKTFKVQFSPVGESSDDEHLVICSDIGEYRILNLSGQSGSCITTRDTQLMMGHSDIYYSAVSKSLYLKNNHTTMAVPVYITASTDELTVANSQELVLEAGQERKMIVEFLPEYQGTRLEQIYINAPFSEQITVNINLQVGPLVTIPVMEDVFLCPTVGQESRKVQIPIINTHTIPLQMIIVFTANLELFTVTVVDSNTSNNKQIVTKLSPYAFESEVGYMLSMAGPGTALLDIVLKSREQGLQQTQLLFVISKPRRYVLTRLTLHSCALDPAHLKDVQLFRVLQNALSGEPLSTHSSNREQVIVTDSAAGRSHVFEIEPASVILQGSWNKSVSAYVAESVLSVSNISVKRQNYRIVLSKNLVVSAPLEGSIPAMSALDIVIQLNAISSTSFISEQLHYMDVGAVVVLDEDASVPGLVTAPVYAVRGDHILFGFRRGITEFRLPVARVLQKVSYKLPIRNTLPVEVTWEGTLMNLAKKLSEPSGIVININSADNVSSSDDQTHQSFQLVHLRQTLKPFSLTHIEIVFQATSSGYMEGQLKHGYVNAERQRYVLESLLLACQAGKVEITYTPSTIILEDSLVGDVRECPILLQNTQALMSIARVFSAHRLLHFPQSTYTLPIGESASAELRFVPNRQMNFTSFVCFGYDGGSMVLPVLCSSNRYDIRSFLISRSQMLDIPYTLPMPASQSLAPVLLPIVEEINLGLIPFGRPKRHTLKLCNLSTNVYSVTQIEPASEQLVTWEVMTEKNNLQEPDSEFGNEPWNDIEADWDEFDFCSNNFKKPDALPPTTRPSNSSPNTKRSQGMPVRRLTIKQLLQRRLSHLGTESVLPKPIAPFHALHIYLTVHGRVKGAFSTTMCVNLRGTTNRQQSIKYSIIANAQPPPSFSDRKIDFGIRSIKRRTVISGVLSNPATVPVQWQILLQSLEQHDTRNGDISEQQDHSAPITIFPVSGTMFPGSHQAIEISFSPTIMNRYVQAKYIIRCQELIDIPLLVEGVGAAAELNPSIHMMQFGTIRIGCAVCKTLTISNNGSLNARFFVDCKSGSFSCIPEQGILEGNGTIDLFVSFSPARSELVHSTLEISYVEADNVMHMPVLVQLIGAGGYPDILVHTKEVDFGVALYNCDNVMPLDVENQGDAEASITFFCYHPAINLKGIDKQSTIIPGRSIKQIHVVYRPMYIETLDVKLYVRSTDSRSESFVVTVRGKVGVPKITVMPQELWDHFSFGICKIGEDYKKELQLKNDGNIPLQYTLVLTPILPQVLDSVTTVGHVHDSSNSHTQTTTLMSPNESFSISPDRGALAVNEIATIVVTFRPRDMVERCTMLSLMYNFYNVTSILKGTGGQVLLSLFPHIRSVDFGRCRLNRKYHREINFKNIGNYGVRYSAILLDADGNQVLGSASSNDNKDGEPSVVKTDVIVSRPESRDLVSVFSIANPVGFCEPLSNTSIKVYYCPLAEISSNLTLRIFYEDEYQDILLVGQGAKSRLVLRDRANNKANGVLVDLGIHPVGHESTTTLHLTNEGAFGVDFFIQPLVIPEMSIRPSRGFLQTEDTLVLTITFKPSEETQFETPVRLLWEGAPIELRLRGAGGMGKIEVLFTDQQGFDKKSMDFGVVPLGTTVERRIYLCNSGQVNLNAVISITDSDIVMGVLPEPVLLENRHVTVAAPTKRAVWKWTSYHTVLVPSMRAVEVAAKYSAKSQQASAATLSIEAEGAVFSMDLRGRGGTISLSHKGDMQFGDIAVNNTYHRRLLLQNAGSIPALMCLEWAVVGMPAASTNSHIVKFIDTYSALDPRSGWARRYVLREKLEVLDYKVNVYDRWAMIRAMIYKKLPLDEFDRPKTVDSVSVLATSSSPATGGIVSASTIRNILSTSLNQSKTAVTSLNGSGFKSHKKVNQVDTVQSKRRQAYLKLISTTLLTNQMQPRTPPILKVEPGLFLLPAFCDVELRVEVNLSSQDTYIATLLCKANVPNTSPYEIGFTATPKYVSVIVDDARILNFGRQQIGYREVQRRIFTNVGQKDFGFILNHENQRLSVFPIRGQLKMGASVMVEFAFEPSDQSEYMQPIYFQPDCSQPVKIPFYGAGGFARMTLNKFKRFDFGHCMIGKDTLSNLAIENEGDAILNITRFELVPNESFFKGPDWPTQRVCVPPGDKYELPLIFNPTIENPPPGKLIVGNSGESFEIQLVGVGKEAVLIVSRVLVEFVNCLIGNVYTQKLGLKNVGEVNYPVSFKAEGNVTGLEFKPPNLTVQPFSESIVLIMYRPTKETKILSSLSVVSPYSLSVIPLSLHAGYARLTLSSNEIDFGLFEKSAHPTHKFVIHNGGTINTAYSLKQSRKPPLFQLTNTRGIIQPGREIIVEVTFTSSGTGVFEDHIDIKTDLQNTQHQVRVFGQCEEAILRPEEFNLINLGICPVLETTGKSFSLTNYGKYPLHYQIRNVYPVKISKTVGEISGGQTETLVLSWSTSGGYELRTQIHIITNIGTFNVVVRGKAAYPDLVLRKNYFDFGVCAVGYTYVEPLTLTNKGRVPLSWSIPTVRDGYTVSPMHGSLGPKEQIDLSITFKPNSIGRYASSFIIECKGLNFKEVALIGAGGRMKIDFPSLINYGHCPCNYVFYKDVTFTNSGEVPVLLTLYDQVTAPASLLSISMRNTSTSGTNPASFRSVENTSAVSPRHKRSPRQSDVQPSHQEQSDEADTMDDNELLLPEPFLVLPSRSVRCAIGLLTPNVGQINRHILIHSKEKIYTMLLKGVGVKINLKPELLENLKCEHLWSLFVVDPVHVYIQHDIFDLALERIHGQMQLDVTISQLLSRLMSRVYATGTRLSNSDHENGTMIYSMNEWYKMSLHDENILETLGASFADQLEKESRFFIKQKSTIITFLREFEERMNLPNDPEIVSDVNTMQQEIELFASKFSYLKEREAEHRTILGSITPLPSSIPREYYMKSDSTEQLQHQSSIIIHPGCIYTQEDMMMHNILTYPHPKTHPVSLDTLLACIEPMFVDDVSLLYRRPPPFAFAVQPQTKGGKAKVRSKAWEHENTGATALDRRQRHAKTVDFFRKGNHPTI